MIKLTKLDGSKIHLNPDLIEVIEETPDTHITLMNGNRYLVLEKSLAIVEKIIVFKARIIHRAKYGRKLGGRDKAGQARLPSAGNPEDPEQE